MGVLFAAVVFPLGIHQGGDFTQELRQSERLLRGLPLYPANPAHGIWWPPFTALGLVPFARVARWSLALAKACWVALNVACLGWSVARARGWTTSWTPIVLAFAAVGGPLQNNFEYLNLTPILLALIVAAAELEAGRDARAGASIGLATAIKGFPALLLVYLGYRRRWWGVATGIAVAGALTVGAMLPYGPVGAVRAVGDWLYLSSHAQASVSSGSQALSGFSSFFGWPPAAVWLARVACLCGVGIALHRTAGERDRVYEVSLVTLLAVLLSPIAWPHYYILALPAWVGVLSRPAPRTAWGRRLRVATLIVAGLLTSGVLTLSSSASVLGFLRNASYTCGGLLLLILLIAAAGFGAQSHQHEQRQGSLGSGSGPSSSTRTLMD